MYSHHTNHIDMHIKRCKKKKATRWKIVKGSLSNQVLFKTTLRIAAWDFVWVLLYVWTRMQCIKSMWSIQTFTVHKPKIFFENFGEPYGLCWGVCGTILAQNDQWSSLIILKWKFFLRILVNHMVCGGGGVSEPHWLKMISDHHWPFWNQWVPIL